ALLFALLAAAVNPPRISSGPVSDQSSPLDRFGVWITAVDPLLGQAETARRVLDQLGLRWYAGFDYDPDSVPPGANTIMSLPTRNVAAEALVREAAGKRPGSYWLIGREPNVPGGDPRGPAQYAEAYQYYYRILKAADPTARLVAPNVLNWDLTCQAC